MTQHPESESIIEELHRIRREISDRFGGDLSLIAKDAAERLAQSGRPIWQPHPEAPAAERQDNRGQTTASQSPTHR